MTPAATRGPQVGDVLHLHIDGGSRGNPGDAGFGVHVTAPDGSEVAALYGFIGRATNNVAEYQALLHGLRYALEHGARAGAGLLRLRAGGAPDRAGRTASSTRR